MQLQQLFLAIQGGGHRTATSGRLHHSFASLRCTSSCICLAFESISAILSGLIMLNSLIACKLSISAEIDHAAYFCVEIFLLLAEPTDSQSLPPECCRTSARLNPLRAEPMPSPGTTRKRVGAPSRCNSCRMIFSAAAFTVRLSIFLPMPGTSMRRQAPSTVQSPRAQKLCGRIVPAAASASINSLPESLDVGSSGSRPGPDPAAGAPPALLRRGVRLRIRPEAETAGKRGA